MNIPKDKILHFVAGGAASAFAAAVWFVAAQFGAVSMADAWLGAALAALVAGVVKERADQIANKLHPGTHGVEVLDALATAAGAAPVVVLLIAAR